MLPPTPLVTTMDTLCIRVFLYYYGIIKIQTSLPFIYIIKKGIIMPETNKYQYCISNNEILELHVLEEESIETNKQQETDTEVNYYVLGVNKYDYL